MNKTPETVEAVHTHTHTHTHTHRLLLNVNVFSACNELGAGSCLYTQNLISDG